MADRDEEAAAGVSNAVAAMESDWGEDPLSNAVAATTSDWAEDPLAEALEILSQTDPEEVEVMSQQHLAEEMLPDAAIASALEDSFRRRVSSAKGGNDHRIPLLQSLERMATQKRDVFFALYFGLPSGIRDLPPANPDVTCEVTFGELWDAAGVVAYHLRHTWNIQKGQRVLLAYGYGPSGLEALLGCWRAGVVAILAEAPAKPLRTIGESLERLQRIAEECQPIAMVLTDHKTFRLRNSDMGSLFRSTRKMWLPKLQWRATDTLQRNPTLQSLKQSITTISTYDTSSPPAYTFDETSVSPQDLALIQYTAGSTGDYPMPVLIPFASLQACLDMTQRFFDVATSKESVVAKVSGLSPLLLTDGCWGLVHATLLPLMNGWRMYYMSPEEFAQEPLRWLQRLSQHKITWALAPDREYTRVMDAFLAATEAQKGLCPIAHLDLSCVRHWHTFGQPLHPETMALVTHTLKPHGLRENWYTPCYGLTEHVGGALFLPHDFVLSTAGVTRRVAVASRMSLDSQITVKVVHPQTHQELPDGQVGELWLSSPAVAAGYGKDANLTQERMGAALKGPAGEGSLERFLRTGDAAFFENNHVFLCGSINDAIMLHSGDDEKQRVLYPQDVEWIAEQASADVIPGCVAALGSPGDAEKRRLEIVFEIAANHHQDPPEVCRLISDAVATRMGVTPIRVVAIRQHSIPRTRHGKIRRHTTKMQLAEETLDILYIGEDLTDGEARILPVDSVEYMERAQNVEKVLKRYFGSDVDENQSWEALGLTSLSSIDLRYDIAYSSRIDLPTNSFEQYPTPSALKEYIIQSRDQTIPTKLPYLNVAKSMKLSWLAMGFLQAILAVVILILFSSCLIPVWYLFDDLAKYNMEIASIPIFMASFSIIVLAVKWIVVGFYRPCQIVAPSFPYLQWWFVDRICCMWEFWVGRFFVGTPALNLFYILLGAKVSLLAKLDGFCREFDLIEVGPYTCCQHRSLRARHFSSWSRAESGPRIILRPIVIGQNSVIRGMLQPGVTVGEGCTVEKLAVLPEGSQLEDRVSVAGNPAVIIGRAPKRKEFNYLILGLMKLKWLGFEFFAFSVFVLSTQWALQRMLPKPYFEIWIIWWSLFVVIFSAISLLSSIVVKWVLLGRRLAGKIHTNIWTEFVEWAADYHFFLSTLVFQTFSLNSRFCNLLLAAHGMDIDLASKVYFDSFPPSKMDLIHVRRSFVAGVSFDVRKYGAYYPTHIHDSSIGESAHVNAGLVISNAVIPPVSVVSARTQLQDFAKSDQTLPDFSWSKELVVTLVYIMVVMCFKTSVYAGYRYWAFFDKQVPGWCVVFFLAGSITIQATCWMLFILVLQYVTFFGVSEDQPNPWSPAIYAVYLSSSAQFQTWSAVTILWGTQLFNDVARLFGSTIDGRALYFGNRMYDGPFLTVSNRTVSDGSQLCGHSIVYEQVKLGPTKVAGLVHEGTLVIANASITSKHSGPWRPVVQKDTLATNQYNASVTSATGGFSEDPEVMMV
ncbi:Putative fatty-acid--CoA ligase FadD21 [Seminavis robusta]|uniref:Fatty-acid--CoA ligase FadD21 n=1 Tax=Seminavis robusta TaxID=568900 RepID=A0A9N8DJW3_9STRA|nr:Putative fatty-acid--CoA ligase FadD21 [Seminavis robusta]|eukprot:Sro184_g079840.1 Putative fatty-acid--CoA ligase FadD21 (1496) ;mRNA; f:16952-21623